MSPAFIAWLSSRYRSLSQLWKVWFSKILSYSLPVFALALAMIGVVVMYFSTIDSDISIIRSQFGFDLEKSPREAQLESQTFASSCQQSNIDAQTLWWITSCIWWKPRFVPNFHVSSGLRMPICWMQTVLVNSWVFWLYPCPLEHIYASHFEMKKAW